MLRIKIDLVPFGEEDHSSQIGEMVIGNIFTSPDNIAEYIFSYKDNVSGEIFGNMGGFDRNRGVWELINECLNSDDFDLSDADKELLRSKFSKSEVDNERS
jgi:hypothetical protein